MLTSIFSRMFFFQIEEINFWWAWGENAWTPPKIIPLFFSYQITPNPHFSPFFSIIPISSSIKHTFKESPLNIVSLHMPKRMTNLLPIVPCVRMDKYTFSPLLDKAVSCNCDWCITFTCPTQLI